jgi:hypothetical protein
VYEERSQIGNPQLSTQETHREYAGRFHTEAEEGAIELLQYAREDPRHRQTDRPAQVHRVTQEKKEPIGQAAHHRGIAQICQCAQGTQPTQASF